MFIFLIGDGNTNDSVNCSKHSTILICPYFVSECNSDFLVSSQAIKLMTYLKRNYYLSLCCDFVLYAYEATQTETLFFQHFLKDQPP